MASSHVGPIIFANEFARSQLVEHGEVITFRGDRTTGSTWWTDEYGTCKNGDCTVEQIEEVDPDGTVDLLFGEFVGKLVLEFVNGTAYGLFMGVTRSEILSKDKRIQFYNLYINIVVGGMEYI